MVYCCLWYYSHFIALCIYEKAEAETASDLSSNTDTENTSSTTDASETTKSVNLTLNIGGETVTVPTTEAGSEDLLSLLTKNALVTA